MGSSSLAALEIVSFTTSSAVGHGGFVGMMTFPPQCMCIPYRYSQCNLHVVFEIGRMSLSQGIFCVLTNGCHITVYWHFSFLCKQGITQFSSYFITICSNHPNYQNIINGLDNGLVLARRQPIIRTIGDLAFCCIYMGHMASANQESPLFAYFSQYPGCIFNVCQSHKGPDKVTIILQTVF